MMERFEAELTSPMGRGVLLEVPFDVKERFGSARAPVRATINREILRTTVAVYGGNYFVGLNSDFRDAAGVALGDTVSVEMEPDDEPRTIEPPPDLAAALAADLEARGVFDELSFTHRKEYVRWIEEAKRDETRRTRIEKTVEMLRRGVKHP